MSRSRTYGAIGGDVPPSGKYMMVYERNTSDTFWVSRDYGASWERSSIRLAISYACISKSGVFFVQTVQGRVYISTDFGVSFGQVGQGITHRGIDLTSDAGILYSAGADGVVRKSADLGMSWVPTSISLGVLLRAHLQSSSDGSIIGVWYTDGADISSAVFSGEDRIYGRADVSYLSMARDGSFWGFDLYGYPAVKRLQGSGEVTLVSLRTRGRQEVGTNRYSYLVHRGRLNAIHVDTKDRTELQRPCQGILAVNSEGDIGAWRDHEGLSIVNLPSGDVRNKASLSVSNNTRVAISK